MNIRTLLFSVISIFLSLSLSAAEKKRAEDVFKKWIDSQTIMRKLSIASMAHELDDTFTQNFKAIYEHKLKLLNSLNPVLSTLTNNNISDSGYTIKTPLDPAIKDILTKMYSYLDSDMQGFINFMRATPLVSRGLVEYENVHTDTTDSTDKYNALFHMLFAHKNPEMSTEYLFNVGNKIFDYSFGEQTFPSFQKLLLDKQAYPLTRMLYAVAWYNLAGSGWVKWSEESLKTLKLMADQGNQIVYIAGGSDIYQMLERGIYNIVNIDPQLPSQPKYYTTEWEYLLSGKGSDHGIGDTIEFSFNDGRKIFMERTGFKLSGATFKARLANKEIIEIPHSVTFWTITDANKNILGQYILDRRFCQQADFAMAPKKTLLMSFNELYFACLPDFLGGWGISPCKFPTDFSAVIKQLHNPVSRQVAVNMHIASLLNCSDFKYIALGTCIN